MTLAEIIAQLEAATEGNQYLNADIWRAVGLTDAEEKHCREWCRMDGRTDLTRDHYIAAWAPDFTRSLDAALTLVPEWWRLHLLADHYGSSTACFHRAFGVEEDRRIWKTGHSWPSKYSASAQAPTKPLALCVAALKARAAS